MGNVKDQKAALVAQENIMETWQDLLSEAKVEDKDKELGWKILREPTSAVVALILYVY